MAGPAIHNNVLSLIGHTPLVRLDKIKAEHNLKCNLLAKLEGFSAGGSVKVSNSLHLLRRCCVPTLSLERELQWLTNPPFVVNARTGLRLGWLSRQRRKAESHRE